MTHRLTGLFLWAVAFIATPHAEAFNKDYYPHCSPIAHEVQLAWQRGQISERDARGIIERCLDAEDRGVFDS